MGSLKTRLMILLIWLAIAPICVWSIHERVHWLAGISGFLFFWMGICMGLFLFAEPLPPERPK